MRHNELSESGNVPHWRLDQLHHALRSLGGVYHETSTVSVSNAAYTDIANFALATFTPTVDCIVFFTGQVLCVPASGCTQTVAIRNGATVIQTSAATATAGNGLLVPIGGFCTCAKGTAYTFKVSLMNDSVGAISTGVQTSRLAAFALPL